MSIIRSLLLTAASLAGAPIPALAADAASAPAPTVQPGDSWVIDQTTQKGTSGFSQQRVDMTIERVGSETMVVGIKPDGSPMNYQDHIMGLDWSPRQLVGDNNAPMGRPYAFPLTVGETWTTDYDQPQSQGTAHFHKTYKVLGWEDIVVAAGKFHVLKIESDGVADGHVALPGVAASVSVAGPAGAASTAQAQRAHTVDIHLVTYGEVYYAPSVNYFVKSIQEQYNSNENLLVRETQALVSYTPHAGLVSGQPGQP